MPGCMAPGKCHHLGKLRSTTPEAARSFLALRIKHKFGDSDLWITVESTEKERKQARPVSHAVQATRSVLEQHLPTAEL